MMRSIRIGKGPAKAGPRLYSCILADVSDRFLEERSLQHLRQHRGPRSAARAVRHRLRFRTTDLTRTFSSSSDERLNHQLVACAHVRAAVCEPAPARRGRARGLRRRLGRAVRLAGPGRELTFGKCLDVIERVWNGRPGGCSTSAPAADRFPTSRPSAAGRPRAASRIAGCASGRWRITACPFVPGTVFDQNYPGAILSTSSRCGTCSSIRPIRKREVRETHRLLKEDGLLVINYPDIGSWIARLMGRSWVFLLDVHLYYFTRATIRKLLEDAGFDVVRIRPHFQRLALGYMLRRATPYVGAPARVAERIVPVAWDRRMAGAVLDGTDAGDRAQASGRSTDRRLAFGASTMMVRASEVKPRDPLLRRRISASDSSPSRSRSCRAQPLERIAHLQLQRWKSTSTRPAKSSARPSPTGTSCTPRSRAKRRARASRR